VKIEEGAVAYFKVSFYVWHCGRSQEVFSTVYVCGPRITYEAG